MFLLRPKGRSHQLRAQVCRNDGSGFPKTRKSLGHILIGQSATKPECIWPGEPAVRCSGCSRNSIAFLTALGRCSRLLNSLNVALRASKQVLHSRHVPSPTTRRANASCVKRGSDARETTSARTRICDLGIPFGRPADFADPHRSRRSGRTAMSEERPHFLEMRTRAGLA
jgi:hypothetical protein